jgi:hypothetical protein
VTIANRSIPVSESKKHKRQPESTMHAVYFPYMHPALAPATAPEWVSFLSPGMPNDAPAHPVFSPQGLPMPEKESVQYARKVREFSAQFRNLKELSAISTGGIQTPFYQGTARALGDDFKTYLEPEDHRSEEEQRLRLQGQMNLIMAWIIEEEVLGLCSLEDAFTSFQHKMDQTLGVEEGFGARAGGLWTSHGDFLVHWTKLLPWFLLFLGAEDVLVVHHGEMVSSWKDWGVSFEPARSGSLQGLGPGLEVGEQAGISTGVSTGRNLMMDNPLPGDDLWWMERKIRIVCLEQNHG